MDNLTCIHCTQLLLIETITGLCSDCEQKMIKCDGCGEYHLKTDSQTIGENDQFNLCSDCIDSYFVCSDCGELTNNDDQQTGIDSALLCQSCFDDNYTTCEDCGEVMYSNEATLVHNTNTRGNTYEQYVCDSCLDNYERCDDCGEYHNHNHRLQNGDYICNGCFEGGDYSCCDACGDIIHIDNIISNDNGCYCERCYEEEEGGSKNIHSYNYKPSPEFKSLEGNKSIFFGVELETITKKDIEISTAVEKIHENNLFYCKEDGSLPSNGIEIVTHPFTLEWMANFEPFQYIYNINMVKSFSETSTGLHVHISNTAFTGDKHKAFFVAFFGLNPDFITMIAQRDYNNYCKKQNCKKLFDKVRKPKDRYNAVNFCNSNTVEVRVFKGNTKPEACYRAVEFCHALTMFTSKCKFSHLTKNKFITYIADNNTLYPNLYNFL